MAAIGEDLLRDSRAPALAALLLAIALPAGCRREDLDDGSSGGGATPPPLENVQFYLPVDGTTITAPTLLSVTGKGLSQAFFGVDTTAAGEDFEAPFEWMFDPSLYKLGSHVLTITAGNATGSQKSSSTTVTVSRPYLPPEEIQRKMAELGPGQWYEVPYSHLRDVAWTWADPDDYRGNVREVIDAASGGAFDTKRNRLVLFGGGQNYGGNELYAFDVNDGRWSRLKDPSEFPPNDSFNLGRHVVHADGSPVSRHTYDTLAYVPQVDRLHLGGGTAVYPYGELTDFHSYLFDFESLAWQQMSACPSVTYGAVCAAGPDGRVWQQGAANVNNYLSVFDPATDTWEKHFQYVDTISYYTTGEIDPVRNKFVSVGFPGVVVWDLNDPDAPPAKILTSGDKFVEGQPSPGLAYHPGTGRLVAWSGGKDVFTLDIDTGVWTRVAGSGDVDPGAPATRGTFGRWAYVPAYDVFIVVNSVDANVFIYRLP